MTAPTLNPQDAFIVVMGVAGTGKSEIGKRLAARIKGCFVEADDLHSADNVERMRQGIPLTDALRVPWLNAVCDQALLSRQRPVIISCSALKRSYRDLLRSRLGSVCIVFLDGSVEMIAHRLHARRGHFATSSLLESQLRTLEPPVTEEAAIRLDIGLSPDAITENAIIWLSTVTRSN
jgi:gluconokinase